MPESNPGQRVIIMAPVGQDAAAMATLLQTEGFQTEVCRSLAECCGRITEGAGTLLLTEEALEVTEVPKLFDILKGQPAWSELPLIILTSRGESWVSQLLDAVTSAAGSVMVLERPMRSATLVRSVQVALRSRRRQYEVRALLEEQQRAQERMRLATEATGVGIWEWNVIANNIRWDSQMFRIYGVRPTNDGLVPYHTWSQAVLPADLPQQETVLQDTVRRGGRSSREFRIRRPDGECRYIQAVETARTNAQGQVEWVVGTNVDITDHKQAEQALRESEERFR